MKSGSEGPERFRLSVYLPEDHKAARETSSTEKPPSWARSDHATHRPPRSPGPPGDGRFVMMKVALKERVARIRLPGHRSVPTGRARDGASIVSPPNATSSPIRAVLFDLDGTLLDSLADIADAANRVLTAQGFPAHPHTSYRRFIGDGVPTLFSRALPEPNATPEQIAACANAFRQEYAGAWNVASRVYDGIPELLDTLIARGLALAVLSNKPDVFTKECVRHYFARWPFGPVYGDRAGIPRKPDPSGARAIAAELGCDPSAILYVGDTSVDMTTAQRAGMPAVGVSWGFRPVAELWESGARAVIDHPGELVAILDGTRPQRTAD